MQVSIVKNNFLSFINLPYVHIAFKYRRGFLTEPVKKKKNWTHPAQLKRSDRNDFNWI